MHLTRGAKFVWRDNALFLDLYSLRVLKRAEREAAPAALRVFVRVARLEFALGLLRSKRVVSCLVQRNWHLATVYEQALSFSGLCIPFYLRAVGLHNPQYIAARS